MHEGLDAFSIHAYSTENTSCLMTPLPSDMVFLMLLGGPFISVIPPPLGESVDYTDPLS